jgi:membrane-associated progesterone receptor component
MDGLWKLKTVLQIENEKLMEITPEELAYYDGLEGRPAYVAVKNVVYDVTGFTAWDDGHHFDIAAGTDATDAFEICHDHTMLEKLNIVGKLVI